MLKTRILSALILAPIFLFIVYTGGIYLDLLGIAMAMIMLYEFYSMTLGSNDLMLKITGYFSGLTVMISIYGWINIQLVLLLLPLAISSLLFVWLLTPEPIESAANRLSFVITSTLYPVGLMAFFPLLRDMEHGLELSFIVLFVTWSADSCAYFVGRAFGKTKLAPLISPNKTVAGAVGGVTGAIVMALLLSTVFKLDYTIIAVIFLGLFISIFSILGDLVESLIKRSTKVKDSSNLIPGHGGLLDRFDAVLLSAPLVYVFNILYHKVSF